MSRDPRLRVVGPEGGLGHPQAPEVCLLPRMGFPWRWGPGEGGRSAAGCQGGAQVGAECRPRLALQASGRRSPEPCGKPDKVLKRGAYDKAYTDELVELHRRLMALRERNVLQQIVNLIEETGHFNVTNTTFDFDLFSLDETTVRKLQSYLEAVAT